MALLSLSSHLVLFRMVSQLCLRALSAVGMWLSPPGLKNSWAPTEGRRGFVFLSSSVPACCHTHQPHPTHFNFLGNVLACKAVGGHLQDPRQQEGSSKSPLQLTNVGLYELPSLLASSKAEQDKQPQHTGIQQDSQGVSLCS